MVLLKHLARAGRGRSLSPGAGQGSRRGRAARHGTASAPPAAKDGVSPPTTHPAVRRVASERHERGGLEEGAGRGGGAGRRFTLSLRPGHYRVSVRWRARARPLRFSLTPRDDTRPATPPPTHQQPLYYGGTAAPEACPASCPGPGPAQASLPQRLVSRLLGPRHLLQQQVGINPAAASGRRGSRRRCWAAAATTPRPRKSRHRWASLPCITPNGQYGGNTSGCESCGGYEGAAHLARRPLHPRGAATEGEARLAHTLCFPDDGVLLGHARGAGVAGRAAVQQAHKVAGGAAAAAAAAAGREHCMLGEGAACRLGGVLGPGVQGGFVGGRGKEHEEEAAFVRRVVDEYFSPPPPLAPQGAASDDTDDSLGYQADEEASDGEPRGGGAGRECLMSAGVPIVGGCGGAPRLWRPGVALRRVRRHKLMQFGEHLEGGVAGAGQRRGGGAWVWGGGVSEPWGKGEAAGSPRHTRAAPPPRREGRTAAMNRTNLTIHLTPPLPRRPVPPGAATPPPGRGGAGFVRRAFSLDSLGHVAAAPPGPEGRRVQVSSAVRRGAGHPTRRSYLSVPVGVAAPHTLPPVPRTEVCLHAGSTVRPCLSQYNLGAAPHPAEAPGRPSQRPQQQEAGRGDSKAPSGPKKYFSSILHAFGAAAPRLRGVLNPPTCATATPPGEGASPWAKSDGVQVAPGGASSHKYPACSDAPRRATAAGRRNSCDSPLAPPIPTPTPPTRRRGVRAFASRAFINIGGGGAGSSGHNIRCAAPPPAPPRSFSYENLDLHQRHALAGDAPPRTPMGAAPDPDMTFLTPRSDMPTLATPTTCVTLAATAKITPIKAALPTPCKTPTPTPTPMHSPVKTVPPTVTPLTTTPSTVPLTPTPYRAPTPTATPTPSGAPLKTVPPTVTGTATVTTTWASPSPPTGTLFATVPPTAAPTVRPRPRSRSQDSRHPHPGTPVPRPRARSVCLLGEGGEGGTREDRLRGASSPGCRRRPRPPSLPPTPPSRPRRVSPGPAHIAGSQPPLLQVPWWRSWVGEAPPSPNSYRESLSSENESFRCPSPAMTPAPTPPQEGWGATSGKNDWCPAGPAAPHVEVEVNLSEGEVRVVGGLGCQAAPSSDTDTDTDSGGSGAGGDEFPRLSPESCSSTSTSGASGRSSSTSPSPSLVHAAPCWATTDSDAASTDSCSTAPRRPAPTPPRLASTCCLQDPFLPEEVTTLHAPPPSRATATPATHMGTSLPLLDPVPDQDPACSSPVMGQPPPAPPRPAPQYPLCQNHDPCSAPAPAPPWEDPTSAETPAWENPIPSPAWEAPSRAPAPQWEKPDCVPVLTIGDPSPSNAPPWESPSSIPPPVPGPTWAAVDPLPAGDQHASAPQPWEHLPQGCGAGAGTEWPWQQHLQSHQALMATLLPRPHDTHAPTPTPPQAPPRPGDTDKPPRSPRRSRDSSSAPREVPRPAPPRPRSLSASCRYRVQLDIPPRPASFTSLAPPRLAPRPPEPLDETLGALQGVSEPRRLAEKKKNEGNDLYKSKQYREALRLYNQAIELCPDCAAYYSNRSACYMMLSKYTEALSDAREAVRLDKAFVKGYIRVAKCNIALGDATAALSVLREAGELEPGSKAVREEVARAQTLTRCLDETEKACGKGDFRTAIFHLDRALDLALGCKGLKIRKAEHLVALRRYAEAQELVNEILQFDSTNAEAIYVRGMCLYYQDNPEAAFNHFQHVLRLAPDHQKAREVYKKAKQLTQKKEEGNEAFRKGRHQEALTLYTEALAIDPVNTHTNAKLYFNRAVVNAKLSRLEPATEDCTAAINLDEGYLKAYLRRAKCYQQLDRHDDAVRDYEKVVRLDKCHENKRLLQEAKVQLKRSKRKDYYKILGVSKNASDDEIKKSYKKAALVHHPDRHSNGSEKEKQEHEVKFKEIGEAYAVLTDAKKRALYDRGHDLNDPDSGFTHEDIDPSQIFQAFFGGGHGGYAFNHPGAFQQQHQGPYPGGFGGNFPGGFHFQFG